MSRCCGFGTGTSTGRIATTTISRSFLPKGSRIDATITYDNSADNPHNPRNPPRRVQFGMQSFDEMGAVGFLMVAANMEDEDALRQQGGAMLKAALKQAAQSDAVKHEPVAAAALPGRCESRHRGRLRAVMQEIRSGIVTNSSQSSTHSGPPPNHELALRSGRSNPSRRW